MTGSASVSNWPRSHSPTPEAVWHTAFMPCRPIPTSSTSLCSPPVPGTVELYPLLSTGLPDDSILTLVESFCSDEKVRPLTDTVRAKTPVQVDYTIDAQITIYRNQDANSVKDEANNAIQNWVAARRTKLGVDIVPGQINAVLTVSGVYQVELPGLELVVLAENEWANCTAINVTITGVVDG